MFVNKNLFSALEQFRSPNESRMLWIDFLCINQTDLMKRTLQVALIGDIFAKADSVCSGSEKVIQTYIETTKS
jgi:hypothetical protein